MPDFWIEYDVAYSGRMHVNAINARQALAKAEAIHSFPVEPYRIDLTIVKENKNARP